MEYTGKQTGASLKTKKQQITVKEKILKQIWGWRTSKSLFSLLKENMECQGIQTTTENKTQTRKEADNAIKKNQGYEEIMDMNTLATNFVKKDPWKITLSCSTVGIQTTTSVCILSDHWW